MAHRKTTFALFFGNRGMFPASLIAGAREEMVRILEGLGHDVLILEAAATRHGAVETAAEGEVYARFLEANRSKFGGVIVCLPNFGDETGAVSALKRAGVPILIQAYPDEMDRMAPALRRDGFCGKLSIMDVFHQNDIPFTALKPHTVSPSSDRFKANVDTFDRICRVVNGMKDIRVGAIGARTTPFKTVRIDEIALQHHDITVETMDLSEVFARMNAVKTDDPLLRAKSQRLAAYSSWQGVPEAAFDKLARLGVTLDRVVDEFQLDALAFRCWSEIQNQQGISPCVIMGEMNNRDIPSACEVDLGSALAMRALNLAADGPAACLDWNNNFNDEDDKCILFHCGPVPTSLMVDPGRIVDHMMVRHPDGPGHAFGCNVGRIAPMPFTFGNLLTEAGTLKVFLGEGQFTSDVIPDDFFGVAGVAQIKGLQDVLLHMGKIGHRHHVAIAPGHVMNPAYQAMSGYLGFEVTLPQAA